MTNEVVENFKLELEELEWNSKPIITSLTMIAEENISVAPFLASVIENRILSVDAERRLPLLYLMDSIIKNIGDCYIELFARNVVVIFVDTFSRASPQTRSSLLKLLATWNGLFSSQILALIQQQILSYSQTPQQIQQPSQYYYYSNQPTTIPQQQYWYPNQQIQQNRFPVSVVPTVSTTTTTTTATINQQQQQQQSNANEYSNAVYKLYGSFKAQCSTCGLRFMDLEKMAKHMDWHFNHFSTTTTTASSSNSEKVSKSRAWFLKKRDWIHHNTENSEIDTMKALNSESNVVASNPLSPLNGGISSSPASLRISRQVSNEDFHCVLADDMRKECVICGDKFEQFWNSDTEEWLFRDAMEDKYTKEYMHYKCYLSGKLSPQQRISISRLPQLTTTMNNIKQEAIEKQSLEPPPTKRVKEEAKAEEGKEEKQTNK